MKRKFLLWLSFKLFLYAGYIRQRTEGVLVYETDYSKWIEERRLRTEARKLAGSKYV